MTMNDLTFQIYRNGDEYIVGASEWQQSLSVTRGVVRTHSKEYAEML
jgi:hypothetical protein